MFRDLITWILVKSMILVGNINLRTMHRNTKKARELNEKLLMQILRDGENSSYGREHHFSEINSADDYRRMVPVTTFEDYRPYIDRMIENNEEDALTSLPLVGYAQTSGTTGASKYIPLTQKAVNFYKRYTLLTMMALADSYRRKTTGKGIKPSRGIFMCLDFNDYLPNGRPATNVGEVAAKQLGFVFPYILNPPFTHLFRLHDIDSKYLYLRFGLENRDNLYIFALFFNSVSDLMEYLKANWEVLVDDIEKGTISDISRVSDEIRPLLMKVIRPNPGRAAELRSEFGKGFDDTIIERIWPNLSVIYAIGTTVYLPFANNVRRFTGNIPFHQSIYGASEGLFASPDELNVERKLMLVDGCFLEFIPVEEEEQTGEVKTLLVDELEVGKEYEMCITNMAGLYRYRFGDIVMVVSYMNQCPYIIFCRRRGNLINVAGEKTSETDMEYVIERISKEAGVDIFNWVVYVSTDTRPAHYTLVLENPEGKDLTGYADLAEEAMGEANLRYHYWQNIGYVGRITIQNQRPGTHAEWAEMRVAGGTAPTQVKPVRILDTEQKMDFFLSRLMEPAE